ncbi:hypothetical protein M427DRAFT_156435 [Gonapodya prolifera JEL478]|uniref:Uncharacterized protein n=1 Tax=Gonapodya prolifera (strain JEL478) TaxID=1344416 RepID=A0A139AAE0_GONPJ|nr:hypothetical protein M427DRAFT_156435 [Gonapodya prolifera JEL478]|eukprot:KXS13710.1 hypothetical protein M427DRAFT_156435 [Gonapodya prolifera JEL478]
MYLRTRDPFTNPTFRTDTRGPVPNTKVNTCLLPPRIRALVKPIAVLVDLSDQESFEGLHELFLPIAPTIQQLRIESCGLETIIALLSITPREKLRLLNLQVGPARVQRA